MKHDSDLFRTCNQEINRSLFTFLTGPELAASKNSNGTAAFLMDFMYYERCKELLQMEAEVLVFYFHVWEES